MSKKENKGGMLTNEQVEQDLKVKGTNDQPGGYRGTQDTGEQVPRPFGTDVQKNDGLPPEEKNE